MIPRTAPGYRPEHAHLVARRGTGAAAMSAATLDEVYRWGGARAAKGPRVDVDLHRPVGRDGRELGEPAWLSVVESHAVIRSRGRQIRLRANGLDRDDVARLSGIDRLDCSRVVVDEWLARVLAQVSACGVVVNAPHVAAARDRVGEQLLAAWRRRPPAPDPLAVCAASVRQRRAALGEHGRRRGRLIRPSQATVSVVLATRRPERLRHALSQVASQTHDRLELVLGLHGGGFDRTRVDRLVAATLPHVHCEVVAVPDHVRFGAVLARATLAASGRLVAKFDDDDWYGPDHVADLVLARAYSGADVVGKSFEYINFPSLDITVQRPVHVAEAYSPFVAGGTLLLAADALAAVGGWRPVRRGVDRALLTAVRDAGGSVYATHGLGYLYVRHGDGHTWQIDIRRLLDGVSRRWSEVPSELGVGAQGQPPLGSAVEVDLRQRDGERLLPLRQGF